MPKNIVPTRRSDEVASKIHNGHGYCDFRSSICGGTNLYVVGAGSKSYLEMTLKENKDKFLRNKNGGVFTSNYQGFQVFETEDVD